MALVAFEGFDLQRIPKRNLHINEPLNVAVLSDATQAETDDTNYYGWVPGRSGGYALRVSRRLINTGNAWDAGLRIKPPSSMSTITMGCALLINQDTSQPDFLDFNEGTTVHLRFALLAGQLKIYLGPTNTTLIATVPGFTINAWNHLEINITMGGAGVGVLKVLLNSSLVVNLTGVNTVNGGTGVIDNITNKLIQTESALPDSHRVSIDDLYIANDMGPYGDCAIKTLIPNAVGASSGWTRSTGTTNYTLVDEVPYNTTDYVSALSTGTQDLYNLTDSGYTTGEVLATQVQAVASKADAGIVAGPLLGVTRSTGGVLRKETIATTAQISTTYVPINGAIQTTDPNGDPLTLARIDGMQAGVEIG